MTPDMFAEYREKPVCGRCDALLDPTTEETLCDDCIEARLDGSMRRGMRRGFTWRCR